MNFFFKEPREPWECKILVFHGRPNPDQAYNGFMGKGGLRYVKPTKWLDKYWDKSVRRYSDLNKLFCLNIQEADYYKNIVLQF